MRRLHPIPRLRFRPFSFVAVLIGSLVVFSSSCGGGSPATVGSIAPPASPPAAAQIPLNDLGTGNYQNFQGGLYSGGANTSPPAHLAEGLARGASIRPLDTSGSPNAGGQYVLLSIGMSNTTQEFCSQSSDLPCDSWTFMGQAAADPAVNKTTLAIVNGAAGGRSADFWDSPADPDYDRVRDTKLLPRGLSERQVQIVWVKIANPSPTVSRPSAGADAYRLLTQTGNIVRTLKVRYPNVKQVFVSSRIYGGYANTNLNPEPYAYESAFAMKWLIEAQVNQMQTGTIDVRAGDLNYNTSAPWVDWGPYLWANGTTPRSDGLTWVVGDLENDGTHPSQPGETKVGTRLLQFFKGSPVTKCWFVVGGNCP